MTGQDEGALPSWPPWSRVDDRGLVRYITPQASRWLPLPVSRFDLASQPDQRQIITRAIYDALKERGIRYALEAYHPSVTLQTIRTPPEILTARVRAPVLTWPSSTAGCAWPTSCCRS